LSVAQRSQDANRQAFASGIEMCNGAGVCRKLDGVMCPSFQATHDEMHSTRGRANLLRALISGRFSSTETGMEAVREALDLCLACKACKAECPSGVDVAKLKYEFYNQYYTQSKGKRRPLRDYLFGYIEVFARIGHPFAPLANLLLSSPLISGLGERTLGLSRRRTLPRLERRTFSSLAREKIRGDNDLNETILLLNDAFTEYFYPQTGLDALETLQACGSKVRLIPVLGAGRTFISKGLLDPARRHAFRLLKTIREMDPQGIYPVVGIEPSEIYTVRDEFLDLFLDEDDLTYAQSLARRAWMIDEFLVRPAADGKARNNKLLKPSRIDSPREVYLHGHCYQKAQPPADDGYPSGVSATQAMLEAAGFQVNLIEAGCCGMAGAFGYESEHYELSMKIGDLGLLPAVRDAGVGAIIAASGVSCQAQIKDGTGREAVHPISLVRQSLGSSSGVGEGF
jgi:Fe-S oxidoreductase